MTARFVELVRVSSSGQAERDTPEVQRRALDAMRGREPGTLVKRIEVPEGISGARDFVDRPDLQELAGFAQDKAFDQLRVYALDRITRHADPGERFIVYKLVRDAGAIILDTRGQRIDPKDEAAEPMYYLATFFAAMERKKIAGRMHDGKVVRARDGGLICGQPPYGRAWDKETRTWKLIPEKVAVYRRIFDLILAGRSTREIADTLNREGVPPPRPLRRHKDKTTNAVVETRGQWEKRTIIYLLRDPAASGNYGKRSLGPSAKGGEHLRRRLVPDGERPLGFDPIVDEDTQRKAIAQITENNRLSGPRPKVFVLLRKLLRCAECGSRMYAQKSGGANHGGGLRKYYCPKCGQVRVPVADVDQRFVNAIRKLFSDPDRLLRLRRRAASAGAFGEDPRAVAEREATEATKQLKLLDAEEERLARQVVLGNVREKIGTKLLTEIKKRRADAKASLANAAATITAVKQHAEDVEDATAWVEKMREGLSNISLDMCVEHPDTFGAFMRRNVESLFPAVVKLHRDGEIEFAGWIHPDPGNGGGRSNPSSGPRTASRSRRSRCRGPSSAP